MFTKDHIRSQMIHGNIKKTLDLATVKIHCKHTISTGRCQKIRDQFGRNRHTGLVFAILTRITEIRNDSRDTIGRSTPGRIAEHEQFHQVIIHRRGCAVYNKHIMTAHMLTNLHVNFRITEPTNQRFARSNAQVSANAFCQ
jgi:hypothetical protein